MTTIPTSTNDYRSQLGERILAARLRADLTQGQLAARVHTSQQTVAKWEAGLSAPRAGRMDAVTAVLGPLNGEQVRPLIAAKSASAAPTPATNTLLRELLLAETIICAMLGMMTTSQKIDLAAKLEELGVAGEGATRFHERRAAITAAGAA